MPQLFRFAFQEGQPADPEKSAPRATSPAASSEPPAEEQQSQTSAAPQPSRGDYLSEDSRLAIIRAIWGEFVRARISIPGNVGGFHVAANQPYVPPQAPAKPESDSLASSQITVVMPPPVIHEGEEVQITGIRFREKSIVFELNGGGRGKWRLRDHLHIDVSGPVPTTTFHPVNSGPQGLEDKGSTLFLDFDHKLPDLSPEDLKEKLAPILDFSSHRSAAVHYVDSLPPEFQQAIKNGIAAIGMDHEMVLAAMDRPDRKVRERDADGNETEDWIYGNPPGKTVLVTFIGEKVVRVLQFP
jgi:hypothetical protein